MGSVDVPRLLTDLAILGNGLPLIETTCRHNAAVPGKAVPKCRFLGNGFAAGVVEFVADARILRPRWNQTPANQLADATDVGLEANDQDVALWGDVVSRIECRTLGQMQLRLQPCAASVEGVTSAHDGKVG